VRQLIIDTDPGVDDAQAIMLANAYPGVAIKAITAVAGNIGLEKTVTNSCKILDFLGEDAPIFAGCDSALVEAANHSAHVHGNDGLGDAGFAPSRRPVEREHALSGG
jgi:purine nucleosidase